MSLRQTALRSNWARRSVQVAGTVIAVICSLAVVDTSPALAAATGGVNTWLPGSTCVPTTEGATATAPEAGVSTTALGTAPDYYELGAPSGAFLGQPPKGLMMVIHGGGWYWVGSGAVASLRPSADLWRNRGWETLNIDYGGCAQSLDDVLWFHDAARAYFGPTGPLCAFGQSAGAQLALMLADARSDLGCAITEGAPTDLQTLASETAFDPTTGTSDQTTGPGLIENLAVAAFGSSQLTDMSPVTAPGTARLLLAGAQQDEFIPAAQMQDMASADATTHPGTYVDTDNLSAGTYIAFAHTDLAKGTGASQSAYDDYLARQLRLVAPLVASAGVTKAVINDIRVPTMGNWSVGDQEMDLTEQGSTTAGTVSGRILLGAGSTYQIQTCLAYFDPVNAPVGWCNQSSISTQGNSGPTGYPIPSTTGSWSNPTTGSGFAYAFTHLSYLSNGRWVPLASSMPDIAAQSGTSIP